MNDSINMTEVELVKAIKVYKNRYRFKAEIESYNSKKDLRLFGGIYCPLIVIVMNLIAIIYLNIGFPIIKIILALVVSSNNIIVLLMLLIIKNNVSKIPFKFPFRKEDVIRFSNKDVFLYNLTNIYFKCMIIFLSFSALIIGTMNIFLIANIDIFNYVGDEKFMEFLSIVLYLGLQIIVILGLKTTHKLLYETLKHQRYYLSGLYNNKKVLFID